MLNFILTDGLVKTMKAKLQIIGSDLGWDQLEKTVEVPEPLIKEGLEIILDGYHFTVSRIFFNSDNGEVKIYVTEPNVLEFTLERAVSLGWKKGRKE